MIHSSDYQTAMCAVLVENKLMKLTLNLHYENTKIHVSLQPAL